MGWPNQASGSVQVAKTWPALCRVCMRRSAHPLGHHLGYIISTALLLCPLFSPSQLPSSRPAPRTPEKNAAAPQSPQL